MSATDAQMPEYDELLLPTWVIPVEPAGVVLTGQGLAIRDGRIAAIGPADVLRAHPARRVRELPGMALIPGLVNAHGHAAMSLFRGMADDLPLMTWLENHIWPSEKRWVDARFVADGMALAMAEMVMGGITCFADMYFFPPTAIAAVEQAGLRAQLTIPVLDFPVPGALDVDTALRDGVPLFDELRGHARIRLGFGPHAPYSVGNASLTKVAALADQHGATIQMHVHETPGEIETSLNEFKMRPLSRLAQLGLLGPHFQAVHMTQIADDDLALLVASGAHVIHCPESNLKLASGWCPVDRLWQAGVNVAVGTDGAASNNDLDLLGETRTAALLAKMVAGSCTALSAHQALRMATLNGARALGMGDDTGSLEVGKAADVVAIDLSGLAQQPLYDPVSQIIYTSGRHQVRHVWVAGKALLRDGVLLQQDEAQLGAMARQWQTRMTRG